MSVPITGGTAASSTSAARPSLVRRMLASASAVPVADPAWPPTDPTFPALMLTALNRFRAQNNAPPLVLDARLLASSAYKARHMAQYLYMAHDDPDTPGHPAETFVQRVTAFYGAFAISENIAYGDYSATAKYDTAGHLVSVDLAALAEAVVQAFASDIGHRANELNASVAAGFAVAWSAPTTSVDGSVVTQLPFVVQDYGWDIHVFTPGPGTPPPPPPPQPTPSPQLPAVGSKWRPKLNPLAKPITVVAVSPESGGARVVHYQNARGKAGGISLTAFLKRYRPA